MITAMYAWINLCFNFRLHLQNVINYWDLGDLNEATVAILLKNSQHNIKRQNNLNLE